MLACWCSHEIVERWWQLAWRMGSGGWWHSWHHHHQLTWNVQTQASPDLDMVPRHLQGRHDDNWGLWVWVEFISGSHSHNKVGKQELKSRAWLCCNHCCRTSLKYQILSICLTVNICFQIPMARSGFLGTFLRYFIQSDLSLIQSRSDNIQERGSNLEYFRWIWVLLRYR